jgi:hypothetical protein
LADWIAFFNLEPFGPQEETRRAGIVAAQFYNSFLRGRGERPRESGDYLWKPIRMPEPVTVASEKAKISAVLDSVRREKARG